MGICLFNTSDITLKLRAEGETDDLVNGLAVKAVLINKMVYYTAEVD